MNAMQRGVITLIKSAITGQVYPLPEEFHMDDAMEWIRRHHMIPLVYDGAVRCGISRNTPVMKGLFKSYCKAMLISEGQMRQFHRICQAFDKAGVDYMPLKGCRMKGLYPKPELRQMGDVDILIRLEQYGRVTEVMTELGFAQGQESDHELVWQHPELYTELHKRLIPSYNRDLNAYFGIGWDLAKIRRGNCCAMTVEDEMVYLFTHFAKHYRDGGIGCRHVTDLWVFRRANPGLDEAYVRRELEKLHLLEFYDNILALIECWFEGGPEGEKQTFLTEYIFASGSWGKMDQRLLSVTVRDMKKPVVGVNGRVAYLWRMLFPGVLALRQKYTILQKAPWTLPLVWLVRPFYKVFFERNALKKHREEIKMLDKQALKTHQDLLNYVGLDYHF